MGRASCKTFRSLEGRDDGEGSTYHLVLNGAPGFDEQIGVPDCGVIRPCSDLLTDALRMRHSLKITAHCYAQRTTHLAHMTRNCLL